MKKLILLLPLFLALSACDDENDFLPQQDADSYKLAAMYSDPGNGSGDFHDVDSERVITFINDSTITINANICDFGVETASLDTITFSPGNNMLNTDCNAPFPMNFSITGNTLILNYACIEACQHKYNRQ